MAPRSTKPNGDPENFARLVKVYSVLKIWDQKRWANMPAQPLQTSKVGRFDEGLVEGMRRWVRAGFDKDAVPKVLIALLTVNCERATDKASEERIRESMVRLSRVLDEYCVTGSSSVRHSFPLGKASKQASKQQRGSERNSKDWQQQCHIHSPHVICPRTTSRPRSKHQIDIS